MSAAEVQAIIQDAINGRAQLRADIIKEIKAAETRILAKVYSGFSYNAYNPATGQETHVASADLPVLLGVMSTELARIYREVTS